MHKPQQNNLMLNINKKKKKKETTYYKVQSEKKNIYLNIKEIMYVAF